MQDYNPEEYFEIPNPIYDVVFKYLMDDEETAKEVLEILTGYKIVQFHVDNRSHAYALHPDSEELDDDLEDTNESKLKLFHLDFTATIQIAPEQTEVVMIEIQKANRLADIFRFKRYIARNFQRNQAREISNPKTGELQTIKFPLKLIPIFILNFRVEKEHEDLVIHSRKIDEALFLNKPYSEEIFFTKHLTYGMFTIQLPNLKNIRPQHYENDPFKEKLYRFFKLFDQDNPHQKNVHKLLLMRREFPSGVFRRIINRLKSAMSDYPMLEEQMHVEDEYLEEWRRQKNSIAFLSDKVEEQTLELEKQQHELEKQQQKLEKQQEELETKNKAIIEIAKMLKSVGKTPEEIHQITGLPKNQIHEL